MRCCRCNTGMAEQVVEITVPGEARQADSLVRGCGQERSRKTSMEEWTARGSPELKLLISIPPGEADVIISVNKDFHVEQLSDALHVQHQDALKDDDICRIGAALLRGGPRVRDKIVHRDVHGLPSLDITP